MEEKTYTFHVNGMHCNSCVVLTEHELKEVPEVSKAKASLKHLSVEVTGEFGDKTQEHIAKDLSEVLKPHGYTLSLEKTNHSAKWKDFYIAFPIAAAFVLGFLFLQKIGLVNLITTSEVGYGTAFIIGIVASLSTCMAVVGGLVLSTSSNFAKEGDTVKPQLMLHVGRLLSFLILGGVIGAFGAIFQLGSTSIFILSIVIALVLIVLGINLLDVFPSLKKLQPTMPGFIGKRVHNVKSINHTLTPFLVGVATFFLPCGFTQSMQLYTLTTGSFIEGSLIMFAFALGTLPVLLLLSFGSLGLHKRAQSSIFFKAAGLIVIFFGIVNIINALAAKGIINPLFNF